MLHSMRGKERPVFARSSGKKITADPCCIFINPSTTVFSHYSRLFTFCIGVKFRFFLFVEPAVFLAGFSDFFVHPETWYGRSGGGVFLPQKRLGLVRFCSVRFGRGVTSRFCNVTGHFLFLLYLFHFLSCFQIFRHHVIPKVLNYLQTIFCFLQKLFSIFQVCAV